MFSKPRQGMGGRSQSAALAGCVVAMAAACTPKSGADPSQSGPTAGSAAVGTAPNTVQIASTAFTAGGSIPAQYTCEGSDRSPPLSWSNLPGGTKSVALIIDDPDAPDPQAPKRVWVHWVLYNLPPDAVLTEGITTFPPGTRHGKNDFGKTEYGGPCPPIGRHRYFHKVYALDVVLGDLREPTKAELEQAMVGHVLARGELIGTYEKATLK